MSALEHLIKRLTVGKAAGLRDKLSQGRQSLGDIRALLSARECSGVCVDVIPLSKILSRLTRADHAPRSPPKRDVGMLDHRSARPYGASDSRASLANVEIAGRKCV